MQNHIDTLKQKKNRKEIIVIGILNNI